MIAEGYPDSLFEAHLAAKSGSRFLKTYWEYLGMFERNLSSWPAGMIWSVVILSPTLIATLQASASGMGVFMGGGPMFGPRNISTFGRHEGGTTRPSSQPSPGLSSKPGRRGSRCALHNFGCSSSPKRNRSWEPVRIPRRNRRPFPVSAPRRRSDRSRRRFGLSWPGPAWTPGRLRSSRRDGLFCPSGCPPRS